jgi:hypothetical protein
MTPAVIVDAAGGQTGGAARYWGELLSYLARTGRDDIAVLGARRYVGPGWLLRRELRGWARTRRVALNNIGFVTPGAQRWTLQRNALYFLEKGEEERLDPARRAKARREAAVVYLAARRSDVIVAPCTAMAERIAAVRPELSSRVIVRLHPVSVAGRLAGSGDPVILCPVLFASYKEMPRRLTELLAAVADLADPSVRGPGDGVRRGAARSRRPLCAGRAGGPPGPWRAAEAVPAQPCHLLSDRPGVIRLSCGDAVLAVSPRTVGSRLATLQSREDAVAVSALTLREILRRTGVSDFDLSATSKAPSPPSSWGSRGAARMPARGHETAQHGRR